MRSSVDNSWLGWVGLNVNMKCSIMMCMLLICSVSILAQALRTTDHKQHRQPFERGGVIAWGFASVMALITQVQLDALLTLHDVMEWAGLVGADDDRGTIWGAFLHATGAVATTLPRMFGVIEKADFDAVVAAIQLQTGTLL